MKSKKVGFGEAISRGLQGYVQFRGTASRSEYWFWILFTLIISIAAGILDSAIWPSTTGFGDFSADPLAALDAPTPLGSLASLALFLPGLTLLVRRIRDAGFSAKWLLLWLAPLAYLAFAATGIAAMAFSGGFGNIEDVFAVLFLIIPLAALSLAVSVVFIVFTLMPTRSFYDGNKYAEPEPLPPLSEGTTA
jgi:uncharacterized membrane protein YhaH (DUF805 family)